MGWKVWRMRNSLLALGAGGLLLLAPATRAAAQVTAAQWRLTAEPRALATRTQNPAAADYTLALEATDTTTRAPGEPVWPDSTPSGIITVPPQCEGVKRCPLLVFIPAGRASAQTRWLRPIAEKYGIITLATSMRPVLEASRLDAVLKEVFQRFAIDPEKIGIGGRCATGGVALKYGVNNLHVFNRIVAIDAVDGWVSWRGIDSQNKTAEFFLDEGTGTHKEIAKAVQELRQGGHPVQYLYTLRGHEHQTEDYDALGRWLAESWAKPPAQRTPPTTFEPLPLLTPKALDQLITFWNRFVEEPDWLKIHARRAYVREVVLPVWPERPLVPLTDMAALAAKYPEVAADLQAAGLTGEQHDAYRLALLAASVVRDIGNRDNAGVEGIKVRLGSFEPNSVLAQNLKFFDEHEDKLAKLNAVSEGIGNPDGSLGHTGGCCPNPLEIDRLGRMGGFWSTP